MRQDPKKTIFPALLASILCFACGGRNQTIDSAGSPTTTGKPVVVIDPNSADSSCAKTPTDPICQGQGQGSTGDQSNGNQSNTNAPLAGSWDALLDQACQQGMNLGDVPAIVDYNESCDGGETPPLKPILGARSDRPNDRHPDLNIWRRGMKCTGPVSLKTQEGPEDPNAVRIYSFLPKPKNEILPKRGYQVYDWNWPTGGEETARGSDGYKINDGSRGSPIGGGNKETTAVGFQTIKGSEVRVPKRVGQYVIDNYIAIVLYASNNAITLKYTRDDNAAYGYTVHIAGVCVNSNIVSAFKSSQISTNRLAVKEEEVIGKALGSEILFMVRDQGSFMNPLDTNHWWDN